MTESLPLQLPRLQLMQTSFLLPSGINESRYNHNSIRLWSLCFLFPRNTSFDLSGVKSTWTFEDSLYCERDSGGCSTTSGAMRTWTGNENKTMVQLIVFLHIKHEPSLSIPDFTTFQPTMFQTYMDSKRFQHKSENRTYLLGAFAPSAFLTHEI